MQMVQIRTGLLTLLVGRYQDGDGKTLKVMTTAFIISDVNRIYLPPSAFDCLNPHLNFPMLWMRYLTCKNWHFRSSFIWGFKKSV